MLFHNMETFQQKEAKEPLDHQILVRRVSWGGQEYSFHILWGSIKTLTPHNLHRTESSNCHWQLLPWQPKNTLGAAVMQNPDAISEDNVF